MYLLLQYEKTRTVWMSVMKRRVRLFLITLYVNIEYFGWNNIEDNTKKFIFWLSRHLRKMSRQICFSIKCLNLYKSITSADGSLLRYYWIYFCFVCLCRYWVNIEINIFGSSFALIFDKNYHWQKLFKAILTSF